MDSLDHPGLGHCKCFMGLGKFGHQDWCALSKGLRMLSGSAYSQLFSCLVLQKWG
jgi:hypothetical protein